MNTTEFLLLILAVGITTALTRFAPFVLLKKVRDVESIKYMGRVFPAVVITILVLYSAESSLPEANSEQGFFLLGVLATAVVHFVFKNMLVSILSGSLIYLIPLNFL